MMLMAAALAAFMIGLLISIFAGNAAAAGRFHFLMNVKFIILGGYFYAIQRQIA